MPPTEFVKVKHPDHGEDAKVGTVPARSLGRWLKNGYVQVDVDGDPLETADAPVADEPQAGEAPGPAAADDAASPDGAAGGETGELVEQPDAGAERDSTTTDPGTAADSADTTPTTSSRRRGGAAGPGVS